MNRNVCIYSNGPDGHLNFQKQHPNQHFRCYLHYLFAFYGTQHCSGHLPRKELLSRLLIGWADGRMKKYVDREWNLPARGLQGGGGGFGGTKTYSGGQRPLVAIHQPGTKIKDLAFCPTYYQTSWHSLVILTAPGSIFNAGIWPC